MRGEDSAWGEIKTRTGRVVYDRKKNAFDLKAIDRILLNYSKDIDVGEVRAEASHARAIHELSTNLYGYVADLFVEQLTREEYLAIKKDIRAALDFVAYVIVHGVHLAGVPMPVSHGMLWPLMLLVTRYIEQLFTGSTVWQPDIGPFPAPEEQPPPDSQDGELPPGRELPKVKPGIGGRRYGGN